MKHLLDRRALVQIAIVPWMSACSNVSHPEISQKSGVVTEAMESVEWAVAAPDYVPVLELGMDLHDFRAVLQHAVSKRLSNDAEFSFDKYQPPLHRFTIEHEGAEVMGFTVRVHPAVAYHVLFSNSALVKLVPGDRGGIADYDAFVQKMIAARGMTKDEFEESVRSSVSNWYAAQRAKEPSPILSIFPKDGKLARQYRRHRELVEQYDATQLSLGMSLDEVVRVLGEPQETQLQDKRGYVLFAPPANAGWYPIPAVQVFIETERVVRVFTRYRHEYSKSGR